MLDCAACQARPIRAPTAGRSAGEATRRRIVDAARDVLLERGHGGTSTRAVADEAGVAALARALPLRRQAGLLLEVLERENELLLERQQRALRRPRPAGREVAHRLRLPRRGHPLGLRARAVGAVGRGPRRRGRSPPAGARRWAAGASCSSRCSPRGPTSSGSSCRSRPRALATLVANLFQGIEIELLAGVPDGGGAPPRGARRARRAHRARRGEPLSRGQAACARSRLRGGLDRPQLLGVGDRRPAQGPVGVDRVGAHPPQRRRVGVDRHGRAARLLVHAVHVRGVEVEHRARGVPRARRSRRRGRAAPRRSRPRPPRPPRSTRRGRGSRCRGRSSTRSPRCRRGRRATAARTGGGRRRWRTRSRHAPGAAAISATSRRSSARSRSWSNPSSGRGGRGRNGASCETADGNACAEAIQ